MNENTSANLKKAKNSIWSFFINKRAVSWIILAGITISGLFSLFTMPREIQPEINIPFAAVTIALPGANPVDVESLISEPLERQIANISDIKTLSSSSSFGASFTFIEFEAEIDIEDVLDEINEAVDRAKIDFPEDASNPMVMKAEVNTYPIITFSIIGDQPLSELTKIAEDVQLELENISGVSEITVTGGQQKIIEVMLDQNKVENYGLNIQTIANLIRFSNNNLPVGIISSDELNYSVRIDNRFTTLEEIRNLPLFTTPDNTQILLGDIAEIQEAYPPQSVISRLSIDGEQALNTVSIQVYKKADTNILQIADTAREMIEELKVNGTVPQNIQTAVSNDNSHFIRRELGVLTKNGLQTVLLITAILFLALGLRQGLIAGLSMPLIFLIAFTVMDSQGMTINVLSIFSLVIALGLIVDTTIVVMEGIHENLKKGLSTKDAALLSIYTYKTPLIAGTMTTIFAFFPMLLVSGIMGEFLKTMPITISAVLFASLFIALTIAPSLAAKFVKKPVPGKKLSILEPFFEKIGKKFQHLTAYLTQKRPARITIILITLIAFAASLSLPLFGLVKVEMFQQTDQPYFVIDIETPKGVVLEQTARATVQIEDYLYKIPEVESFMTRIGTSQSLGMQHDEDAFFGGGGLGNSNLANITVNLVDENDRERRSYEVAKQVRDNFQSITTAKISVSELEEGPPGDAAITIRITGDDIPTLEQIATEVEQITQKIPGTANTRLSLTPGLNEFKFALDRSKLALHNLTPAQVSATIRSIIQGIRIQNITINNEESDLWVRYDLPEQNNRTNISIQDIENFEITTPQGYTVTLAQLADYEFTQSLSVITREDETRIIKVLSDTEKNVNAVETIAQIQEQVDQLELPAGYNIIFAGDLEQINESFKDLFKSMLVGILLIAFTLVLMFNSFRQPIIILITLPLALIGVFPGLYAIGLNLGFPAFLGIVALTGIVVNDAIILIDRINKNRETGMEFAASIAEAANARLQPILITSITTIVGILPLALTNEFWSGLGFSLIFGLAASTALMLIVIPTLYYMMEGRRAL